MLLRQKLSGGGEAPEDQAAPKWTGWFSFLDSSLCQLKIPKIRILRESGTPDCSSSSTSLSCENGEPAIGQPVNGGEHVEQHVEGGDGDAGQPAAVLPSPDSPAACAEANTKWDKNIKIKTISTFGYLPGCSIWSHLCERTVSSPRWVSPNCFFFFNFNDRCFSQTLSILGRC